MQVRYAVDKILSFRDSGGREEFFIQWSGNYRPSWEPAEIIRKDCPALVKEYFVVSSEPVHLSKDLLYQCLP